MPGSTPVFVPPKPLELALRLLLAYGLALGFAQILGTSAVESLLPAFRGLIELLDGHGRIHSLGIETLDADTAVVLRVRLTEPVWANGRWILPTTASMTLSSITTGSVLLPPIVALGAVLAWPARRFAEYPVRLGLAAFLLALVTCADAPLTLWHLHRWLVETRPFPPLAAWYTFLNNGGRGFLGLLIAILALKGAQQFARHG